MGEAPWLRYRSELTSRGPAAERHLVGCGDQVLVVTGHRQDLADVGGSLIAGVGENHADPGVGQNGPHLRGGEARVNRDQHVTRGREPQVELEVAVGVEGDDPYPIARR
jgi:hypothetical protein